MLEKDGDLLSCGLAYAVHVIDGKWKPYIIWYLNASPTGICRYGELKRQIPWNISHKMLTQQLRELEDDQIINRMEYDEKPVRVEYSLTPRGKLLVPVILYLRDWGVAFSDQISPQAMERTLGDWDDKTISYFAEDTESEKSVEMYFHIGKTKEEYQALTN